GGGSSGKRRQRNAAPRRQRAHQHFPALAHLVRTADHVIEGNEHILAFDRAVLEHLEGGEVPSSNGDTGKVGWHESNGNAVIVLVAEESVGGTQLDGKAENGSDGRERDVALAPVETDADNFFAIEYAPADHTAVDHGSSIRACLGACKPKAGYLLASRELRQPVFALLLR